MLATSERCSRDIFSIVIISISEDTAERIVVVYPGLNVYDAEVLGVISDDDLRDTRVYYHTLAHHAAVGARHQRAILGIGADHVEGPAQHLVAGGVDDGIGLGVDRAAHFVALAAGDVQLVPHTVGKIDAVLAANEQIPGEQYNFMDRVKVYVLEVKQTTKGPQIFVSRTHPELVKRLFEQEVPEVHDGTVEIKSIAREAGSRTKIAVYSKNENVDALGACVGQNGYRVNVIVNELGGEKIDVINWSEDPREFIAAALSPSKVLEVKLNEAEQSAKIVVPDHQLSLAIGKEGQNARLSAKLTGWRIDIKSETQARETNFLADEEPVVEEAEEMDALEAIDAIETVEEAVEE